ncbi:hypothetical protein ACFSTE_02480 [Aquimarina hainanensis]|uniref:NACHT domain-containing protein n=1 Tax=Aquimarina hainanensis TaxID=1578017 RepID=A0ABW5N3L3_9FLAO
MRNAYIGYTYQQQVTLLFLALMDVERFISTIEIEAKTPDNFDDLIVCTKSKTYHFQIKDFNNVTLEDLEIEGDTISINGKEHKLSTKHNVLFFNTIKIKQNDNFLGFPSYKFEDNITFISLSRSQIHSKLNQLYQDNLVRKNQIEAFFSSILDNRIWTIRREMLPKLKTFITKLQEKSVLISHKLLEFEDILFIEGKPGVGKSHFVNTLLKEYKHTILYRFWIGNQDKDYEERLKFERFIADLNTKLFNDIKSRTEEELLKKLKRKKKNFIIDGLDHVENYNSSQINEFINFIDRAKLYCKIIVLSRPLVQNINWKKHTLENWNSKQTSKVLKQLFHISKQPVIGDIYTISQGYPIIVNYLAEHYKLHQTVPELEEIEDINSYYQNIISSEKGKHSLSLFLCTSSYLMKSEIELLAGDEKYYIQEFIKEHPYLFDIKLNRVSLLHDSFNTFLRKQINYTHKLENVAKKVSQSILQLDKRFLSRFSFFKLTKDQKRQILVKYCSIKTFEKLLKHTIDFEAIQSFYVQLREALKDITANELNANHYYDLSLIINLTTREHLSTNNSFYYTYVKTLIANGFTVEDITSSDYLFTMFYYVKTKNASLLYNKTSNGNYDTRFFYKQLRNDIIEEEDYIKKHNNPITKKKIEKALKNKLHFRDYLTYITENIFIHNLKIKGYKKLRKSIKKYIEGDTYTATYLLDRFLEKYKVLNYYPEWMLKDVYKNLIAYGYRINDNQNEYQDLTLKKLIDKHSQLGSFDLRDKIHNQIRLALFENREIDIKNIYPYWTKYYQRKDYSFYSVPLALRTLEKDGLISLEESIILITKIQNISEKGYRHLLAEFIKLYKPKKIITFLEKNFNLKDLRVEWFKLPIKYVNTISERVYNTEMNKVLGYHRDNSILIEEIKNVLYSKYLEDLKSTFNLFKIKIRYTKKDNRTVSKFQDSKLWFLKIEENDYGNYRETKQQRFEKGIISYDNIAFIKKKKLKPYEVALYSDGYYSSLPTIEVFKIYDPKVITYHFKKILYNSLVNKTKSINYFYLLFYHPGNILTMIKQYRNNDEYRKAIESFKIYMKLSMYDIKGL